MAAPAGPRASAALRRLATAARAARFDPTNGKTAFEGVPTAELVRAAAIFELCARPLLITPGRWLVERAVASRAGGPILGLFRRSVFAHFCAGETLSDCVPVTRALASRNVKTIVDHSKEEDESVEAQQDNLRSKLDLTTSAKTLLGESVLFVPIKVTSLVSPSLLEKMTEAIVQQPGWMISERDPAISLCDDDRRQLHAAMRNLDTLCKEMQKAGLAILLDAEQSHRQPAIDYLALQLMRKFNARGRQATVYNTYQSTGQRIDRDLKLALSEGFVFGAKVVRGAYLAVERARGANVVHPDKTATDGAYDSAVAMLLRTLKEHSGSVALLVATHNKASVLKATELMDGLGLAPDHPEYVRLLLNSLPHMVQNAVPDSGSLKAFSRSVHFAQILGMSDNVTYALGRAGYNAHKLVLFGRFIDIFPWLLRRLDENGDMLGAMASERALLWDEIERRAKEEQQ